MSSEALVLGTRGSPLARWQTEQVLHQLRLKHPELQTRVEIIKTQGDQILDISLAQMAQQGDKGLFTKELEQALFTGTIDLAVHSLKDLPTTLPAGMALGAILERHAPQDVLVSRTGQNLEQLPKGALIGTGSLRRQTQLQRLRPDLRFADLRGNIQTRLNKLDRGDYDAIIMARAALERLGLPERISMIFPPSQMLPAVGQGAIAVEIREGDQATLDLLAAIHHQPTAICCQAERAFLRALNGGCEQPIAAHAVLRGDTELELFGLVASEDGQQKVQGHLVAGTDEPEAAGIALAQDLLDRGAQEILA